MRNTGQSTRRIGENPTTISLQLIVSPQECPSQLDTQQHPVDQLQHPRQTNKQSMLT